MDDKPVFVTEPYLPPLEDFIPYLQEIWGKKCLTNYGPYHQQLEQQLSAYLQVEHISLLSNGTAGLIAALRAHEIEGDVITTPYSFVATSHSILWNKLNPVFVDILPDTLNIDPDKIESAITPRTTAILAVHCYGYPCNVKAIEEIATRHRLKVIYDAAHAFGVKTQGKSLLKHGDFSVLSFHATKVYNTFEGGAVISPNLEMKQRIDRLASFGYEDEVTVGSLGTNSKMSEFNAALGLLQLKYIDDAIERRGKVHQAYLHGLEGIAGIRCLTLPPDCTGNFSYFPIEVENSFPLSRDALYHQFRKSNIYVRRYFYPLITDFPMYRHLPSAAPDNLPIATMASRQILCLPIYPALQDDDLRRVLNVIYESARI